MMYLILTFISIVVMLSFGINMNGTVFNLIALTTVMILFGSIVAKFKILDLIKQNKMRVNDTYVSVFDKDQYFTFNKNNDLFSKNQLNIIIILLSIIGISVLKSNIEHKTIISLILWLTIVHFYIEKKIIEKINQN